MTKKMMNIVIITPRLCYGGAERVSVLLADGFAEKGHRVSVISNLSEPASYPLHPDIRMVNFTTGSKHKLSKWISAIRITRQYFKEVRPDAVIGIMSTCSFVGKIASIGLNIPVIATEHDAFDRQDFTPYYWFTKFILNKIYHNLTVLTTPDKELVKHQFKNVHVMPNPLSFKPLAAIPHKEKTILAVGRLEDWYTKGFDVLIKAWANIATRYPDWNLQIAGSGNPDQQNFLLTLAKQYNVEAQTHLIGFHKELDQLLRKAAIFVLSSRYEGFGLVLIEAMSQGCACIAVDYKGRQKEILGSSAAGIILKPEQIHEMSKAIEELILNEPKRNEMSLHAIERSKAYQLDKIILQWENLLSFIQQQRKR